ncbi:low temperature requirement protein A [Cellulosimicrobium terreum]|nr:low temperature requirement protein A [Cellulosimicrobium terreum]
MSTGTVPSPGPAVGAERHASWLELFFDLVVVAGIGMLAHLLHDDPGSGGFALYVVAYTAFWLVWACFTTYGNVAGDDARPWPMLVGMAALAVMIAAVPGIHGEHATAFAVAYVVGRLVAARTWERTTVVLDLPVVQALGGVVPWIVSWWFDGTTQYVLWAAGLAIDLLFLLQASGERLALRAQERLDQVRDRFRTTDRRRRGRSGADVPDSIETAASDVPHLGERLGLFVIIVLGEGLIQAIDAASAAAWDRALAVAGAGAFTLLVSYWALAVRSGYAGVSLLPVGAVPARAAWFLHLGATGALATLAGVLGGVLDEPGRALERGELLLLVGAFAVHGLLGAGTHLITRRSRTAVVVAAPTLVAVAVALLSAGALSASGLVWVLAGALLVQLVLTTWVFTVDAEPGPA